MNIKLPIKSAQGQRQRLRFCDGVSDETLKSLSRSERGKQEAIFELIQTEQNYVQDISIIVKEFVIPLHEQDILPKEEIYNICINLKSLLPINQNFLEDLLQRQSESIIVNDVSDIILKHQKNFTGYIEYCSKHSFALRRVSEYTDKNEKFREFMLKPKPAMKETLQGYLVKPFQRITRYTMLVQSIMKNSASNTNEKLNLLLSYNYFKNLATKANTQLRQEEERFKAVEVWDVLQKSHCADVILQCSISSSSKLFQKSLDNSQLLSENNPMSLASFYGKSSIIKNNGTSQDGFLFLFNDCLLITKGKDIKSLNPLQRIPIQDIKILSTSKQQTTKKFNLNSPQTSSSSFEEYILTKTTTENQTNNESNKKLRPSSLLHNNNTKTCDYEFLLQKHRKNIKFIVTLQCFFRMNKLRKEFLNYKNNLLKINELLVKMKNNEDEFSRKIRILQDIIEPLMNNDDLRSLFYDLNDIPLMNQYSLKIISTLSLMINQNNIFHSKVSFKVLIQLLNSILEPFRHYVTVYSDITNEILSLSQDRPDLYELIKNTEKSKNIAPGSHKDLLDQPSFHVKNYYDIIHEILNHFPSTHNEYKNLSNSCEGFKKLNQYCISLRDHIRNIQKLSSIQSKIPQFDLDYEETGRKFIREGNLILIPEEDDKNLFLFNDILILSDKSNKIRNIIRIDDIHLIDLDDDNHFLIFDCSLQKNFIFKAPRNIHKRRWVKEISDAIDQNEKDKAELSSSETASPCSSNSSSLTHQQTSVDLHSQIQDFKEKSRQLSSSTPHRTKRSSSLVDSPNNNIITNNNHPSNYSNKFSITIQGGCDLWIFSFDQNPKQYDEFCEQIKNSLELIYTETLISSTKKQIKSSSATLSSSLLSNNNNNDKASSLVKSSDTFEDIFNSPSSDSLNCFDDKKFILIPLLQKMKSIIDSEKTFNQFSNDYLSFKKTQLEKEKICFGFVRMKLLQQPNIISLAPPKPPVVNNSSTMKQKPTSVVVKKLTRERANTAAAAVTSKIGTFERIFREHSDPAADVIPNSRGLNEKTSSFTHSQSSSSLSSSLASEPQKNSKQQRILSIEFQNRLNALENDIQSYKTQLESNNKKIDLLESQNKILSENLNEKTDKISQLENIQLNYKNSIEKQQEEIDLLRSTFENYLKERERKRAELKRKRAKRKNKEKSKSEPDSSDISVSQSKDEISDSQHEFIANYVYSDQVAMPDINTEINQNVEKDTNIDLNFTKVSRKKSAKRSARKDGRSANLSYKRLGSDLTKSSLDDSDQNPKSVKSLGRSLDKKPRKRSTAKVLDDIINP